MPISPEAEAVEQATRPPIQKRQPVGYQRGFLDGYRPNVTYYSPAQTRQRLLDMGGPPDGGRPAETYARTIPTPCWKPSACWSWARPPKAMIGGKRR